MFALRFKTICAALFVAAVAIAGSTLRSCAAEVAGGDKYRFVVYGDCRTFTDDHRKVVADIIKLHPEFVIISGDLVAKGTDAAQWDEYAKIVQPFADNNIPLYTVQGNHDIGPLYIGHATKVEGSGNGYYYAFTRHGSRFIVVDSMDPLGYGPGTPQYKWLDSELAASQKSAVNTFVTFHVPPYSVGIHGPNTTAQQNLHPLFVKYHPRIVFCGHDHLYYRTIRDGVPYIISGGAGAPLYDPVHASAAIPGDVYASVHNIVLCDVDGTKVTCTAFAVDHDPTSPTPWHTLSTKYNDVLTNVGVDGPHDTPLISEPGGPVIDTLTVDK